MSSPAHPANPREALRNCVVIDVETTGLDPVKERIIEIGAVHVSNGAIHNTFHELVNPHRKLSSFIKDFTGLTDDALSTARPCGEVLSDFLSFLSDATSEHQECVIVGHNVSFDLSFLQAAYDREHGDTPHNRPQEGKWAPFPPLASLCTAELARQLLSRHSVGRYRLANVAEYLGTTHRPSHRALDDVYATFEVLEALNQGFGQ